MSRLFHSYGVLELIVDGVYKDATPLELRENLTAGDRKIEYEFGCREIIVTSSQVLTPPQILTNQVEITSGADRWD